MRTNIGARLREFWDAGIRGPDFVWAATGPALEAYSKHPVVKKTTDPGKLMTVSEFLAHVRRIVVDYVVGQVLSGGHGGDADAAAAERLDEPTAYYLLASLRLRPRRCAGRRGHPLRRLMRPFGS